MKIYRCAGLMKSDNSEILAYILVDEDNKAILASKRITLGLIKAGLLDNLRSINSSIRGKLVNLSKLPSYSCEEVSDTRTQRGLYIGSNEKILWNRQYILTRQLISNETNKTAGFEVLSNQGIVYKIPFNKLISYVYEGLVLNAAVDLNTGKLRVHEIEDIWTSRLFGIPDRLRKKSIETVDDISVEDSVYEDSLIPIRINKADDRIKVVMRCAISSKPEISDAADPGEQNNNLGDKYRLGVSENLCQFSLDDTGNYNLVRISKNVYNEEVQEYIPIRIDGTVSALYRQYVKDNLAFIKDEYTSDNMVVRAVRLRKPAILYNKETGKSKAVGNKGYLVYLANGKMIALSGSEGQKYLRRCTIKGSNEAIGESMVAESDIDNNIRDLEKYKIEFIGGSTNNQFGARDILEWKPLVFVNEEITRKLGSKAVQLNDEDFINF